MVAGQISARNGGGSGALSRAGERTRTTGVDCKDIIRRRYLYKETVVYKGANHGFHNDTTPRYDEAAAKEAWQRTLDWFNKYLRGLTRRAAGGAGAFRQRRDAQSGRQARRLCQGSAWQSGRADHRVDRAIDRERHLPCGHRGRRVRSDQGAQRQRRQLSLCCSVQSNGRSSSVSRVAVSATGCRPCRFQRAFVCPRNGSFLTRRWRKSDSNSWSRVGRRAGKDQRIVQPS
jgi:hypothetical protein